MTERHIHPRHKHKGDGQRGKESRGGSLPGFVGTEPWRKRMLPDGSACKIRRSVAHPNNNESKEQQRGALRSCAVETNGKGKRKRNQDEAAGADPGSR